MKLIIKLEVREGETSNTVVELEDVDDVHIMNAEGINNFADQYASEYYECTSSEGKWHYTDDMCIAVAVYDVKEVSDEDFEVLRKYI